MSRAFRELCSELWAITPDWLHILAALSLRDRNHPLVGQAYKDEDGKKAPTPVERFSSLMFLGAAARSLEGQGSGRAIVAEGVAILPVLGPIFPRANMMTDLSGATSCAAVHKDLSAALKSEDVSSILMVYDTPGGAVSGVSALADAIFAARGKKPLAGYVSGTAASAGYWLGSAVDRLTASKTSMVGSIGVVTALPKQVEPDADGNLWVEIVSSNAPNKRPDVLTDEGTAEIRRNLDSVEKTFLADVARHRGVTVEKVIQNFGAGGCFVGAEAVDQGMVDGIESFDSAFSRMVRVGKASRARQAAGG